MFQYPATELFAPDGSRRVVWSQEEYEAALATGCTLDKPAASVEVETSATGFQPKPQRGRPRKNPAPVDIEV